MTRDEWPRSDDPARMLAWLTGAGQGNAWAETGRRVSDRRLRLFACACFPGQRGWEDWAEAPVVGSMTAEQGALYAAGLKQGQHDPGRLCDEKKARRAAILRDIVGDPFAPVTLPGALPRHYCRDCRSPMTMEADHHHQLGLWRCTANRKHVTDAVTVEEMRLHKSGGCPWLTPQVIDLARAAYEARPGGECPACKGRGESSCTKCSGEGCSPYGVAANGPCTAGGPCPACQGTGRIEDGTLDPHRLAVLADALEEAGCPDGPVLRHLRGLCPLGDPPGWHRGFIDPTDCPLCSGEDETGAVHVPGCWALDLILGKE